METSVIHQKLAAGKRLPMPSQAALEAIRLCYRDAGSLQDVIDAVAADSALAAVLLRYAESITPDGDAPATTLFQLAGKIGAGGIASMALALSLLNQLAPRSCREFDSHGFWSKSLAQAVAARMLAEQSRRFNPDEVFSCGLLCHIGELGLATAFPEEYGKILAEDPDSRELKHAERQAFDLDHRELGAALFHSWPLPDNFAFAARLHESLPPYDEVRDEVAELAELLHLSWQIANICMMELPLSVSFESIEKLAEEFGVLPGSFSSFFEQVLRFWQEASSVFGIPPGHCPLYHQLKALDPASIDEQFRSMGESDILVLAVDDDPMTLLSLTRILHGGKRRIITAKDGKEALRLALNHRPEMIITDWLMPHLSGLDLCKALRRDAATQHAYIIMLTGIEADDELVQAFDAGADDYVVKPFIPKVLEARIRGGERLIRYQRKINSDREVIQKYAARLGLANRKLHTMAMTDALTGLPNRRSAMARLKDVVAESRRYGEKLSCIMIDIDHFKEVNDTYGHENGDIVLQKLAEIFSKNARSYDMVSRTGGEEFLVISSRSGLADSQQLAERLRAAVEQRTIELSEGASARVTISAGVASWKEGYKNGGELIKAADRALYRAKERGRNRVESD